MKLVPKYQNSGLVARQDNTYVTKPTIPIKPIRRTYVPTRHYFNQDNRSKWQHEQASKQADKGYNEYMEAKKAEQGLDRLNQFATFTDYAGLATGVGSLATKGISYVGKQATKQLAKHSLNNRIKKVNKALVESITDNPVIGAYRSNPRIVDSGTLNEYSKYLDSMFPDSQLQDVYFHGGPKGITKFNKPGSSTFKINKDINSGTKDYGIYFADTEGLAKYYSANKGQVYRVKVNSPSTMRYDNPQYMFDRFIGTQNYRFSPDAVTSEWYNRLGLDKYNSILKRESTSAVSRGQVTVFNPDDIRILGSSEDVQGFRKWKENPIINEYSIPKIPNTPAQYNRTFKNTVQAYAVPAAISGAVSAPIIGLVSLNQKRKKGKKGKK